MSKTKAILLGSLLYTSSRALQPDQLPPIVVDNQIIPLVVEAKNLGVWITPTLSWSRHLRTLSKKVFTRLYFLKFHRHALTHSLRRMLVESLILPHFDFACLVYHDLDKTRTVLLNRLLNACIRFVVGNIRPTDSVTPHRIALGWLLPDHRRELFLASLVFKVLATRCPSYLAERFLPLDSAQIRRSNRRHPEALTVPICRTEAWKRSFTVRGSTVINATGIVEFHMDRHPAFKHQLRQQLLTLEQNDWASRDPTILLPTPTPIARANPPFLPLTSKL